jgi:protein SCO1/2
VLAALLGGFVGSAAVAAAGEAVIPVHGIVVAPLPGGRALVRLDPVQQMLPAGTRSVLLAPGVRVRSGEEIDAFLSRVASGFSLSDVVAAPEFTAGLPNDLIMHVLTEGDQVPAYTLVDQRGARYRLDDVHGKVTILSFVFSRCPDQTICPAISAKFLYLEHRLDPKRYHLIEVTLDPPYDSPAVLARYGRNFDADPARWSLLTGRGSDVKDVIDQFGVAEVATGPANYVHGDLLVVAGPQGKIANIIPTSGWSPDDVIAVARSVDGESSNPLRRFELDTIKNVVAFCGGSSSIAIVTLDCTVVAIVLTICFSALYWWGRRIFSGG